MIRALSELVERLRTKWLGHPSPAGEVRRWQVGDYLEPRSGKHHTLIVRDIDESGEVVTRSAFSGNVYVYDFRDVVRRYENVSLQEREGEPSQGGS